MSNCLAAAQGGRCRLTDRYVNSRVNFVKVMAFGLLCRVLFCRSFRSDTVRECGVREMFPKMWGTALVRGCGESYRSSVKVRESPRRETARHKIAPRSSQFYTAVPHA
jgi:hypothetical protein